MKPTQTLSALLLFASATSTEFFQTWTAGALQLTATGPFCHMDNDVTGYLQDDGNLVMLDSSVTPNKVVWASGQTNPNCNGACQLYFQSDGNLVTYYGTQPLFNTSTTGRGQRLVARGYSPYLIMWDAADNYLWSSA